MASLMFHVSSFSSFWKLPVTSGYALGVMSGACAWIKFSFWFVECVSDQVCGSV